ncbi:MAG: hypothetical protein AAF490_20970 [Chloroflexota bacterium]
MSRFLDDRSTKYDFSDHFLVVCPQCKHKATVVMKTRPNKDEFTAHYPRQLSCFNCGLTKSHNAKSVTTYHDRDWYFGLPLWLSVSCCGETLCANNEEHLNHLEAYISAKLREHAKNPDLGWHNQSWVNRLPNWMKSRKNRDEVLGCIKKLRAKLKN